MATKVGWLVGWLQLEMKVGDEKKDSQMDSLYSLSLPHLGHEQSPNRRHRLPELDSVGESGVID